MTNSPTECSNRAVRELIVGYCFDDLPASEVAMFEDHVLNCERCLLELQLIQRHVQALRSDVNALNAAVTAEDIGVLGMSGFINAPLAGHWRFAWIASLLYAILFAVPVIVEVAYAFDRFGRRAVILAPVVFALALIGSLATFWQIVTGVRSGTRSFVPTVLLLIAWTALICVVVLPLLPSGPTVLAAFQTYPVRLGYLKSVLYAWGVGPVLLFWPFYFVVRMQRELAEQRGHQVLALLERHKGSLPPPGTVLIHPGVMTGYVVAWIVFHWVGVAHLFENLKPSSYMTLFMTAVIFRVGVWIALAVVGAAWYAHSIIELRREAHAASFFIGRFKR